MATASFIEDRIKLFDNSTIDTPRFNTGPISYPFSVSYSGSHEYLYMSQTTAGSASSIVVTNSSSIFAIKTNGVINSPWAAIPLNGSEQIMVRLKSGYYMTARRDSDYYWISWYNDVGTLMALGGVPYIYYSECIHFGYFITKSSDDKYIISIYHVVQENSTSYSVRIYNAIGNNYDDSWVQSTDLSPIIDYTWKSVKSLNLANIEDLLPYTSPIYQFEDRQSTMLLSFIPDEYLNDGEPVSNGSEFTIKAPSLPDYINQYNDTTFSYKNIYLKTKKYARIGRRDAISYREYSFDFYSALNPSLPSSVYYSKTIEVETLSAAVPYLGFIIDEENQAARLNVILLKRSIDASTGLERKTVDYNTISMNDSEMGQLYIWLKDAYGFDESSENTETNQPQGGDETDPVINTPLNRPVTPDKGAVKSGFIKVYEVTPAQLNDLADFMWDDSLITNLGRLFNDPREIIVGLMVFPFTPQSSKKTDDQHIYAGNLDTGVLGNLLTDEYDTRYVGEARIPKGNADFMSFAPYRRIKMHIPYCGEHELDPSAVYGATLKLYYHFSFFSGNCVAEITRTFDGGSEEPLWFFSGSIGYSIPMSSEDFTRMISGIISAGVSIGTALCTYGASTAVAGATKNAIQASARQVGANMGLAGNTVGTIGGVTNGTMSPNVSYSGGEGASSGFLSTQQAYLLFEESITAFDGEQSNYIGNTFYKVKKLNDCTGFTKCFEVHLENVPATEDELNEIMNNLTSGVRIHNDGTSTPSDTPTVTGNTVITFMKLTSEKNVIGKKWVDPVNCEGKLLYDKSITSPSILIEQDVIGYNYAYIGLFKRFYYIGDITIRKNDLMEVSLKSDPLQSFQEEIRNCYAAIERQKHDGNAFVDDPYHWTQINKDIKIVPFMYEGAPFDLKHNEDTYILTIAGRG